MMNSEKRSILLFETIRVFERKPANLGFHLKRAQASTSNGLRFDLSSVVSVPDNGLYRVKVVYDEQGYFVESKCFEYRQRKVESIRLIPSDISYGRKYLDRSAIDAIFAQRGDCDDVLVVRNGCVTDTSIANIAVFSDNTWFTPRDPLLKGTVRQRLIEHNKLQEKDIGVEEVLKAEKIALMNAMIDFCVLEKTNFVI